MLKDIYCVIHRIISEVTDKGQFQHLTNLKGLQEGTISFTKIKINILQDNTKSLHGTTLLPPVRKS